MTVITTREQARETRHVDGVQFLCSNCGQTKPVGTSGGTGYGYNADHSIICYECCAVQDRAEMIETGRAVLYLTDGEVTNWPGTLRFKVGQIRKGRHNMAGVRRDFWFAGPGNTTWHGVQYGENSQVAWCRRIKG